MALEVVHGQPDNRAAALHLADVAASLVEDGTIYLGYPVLATADDRVEIDALLVSQSHGLIAFRFADVLPATVDDWLVLSSEQDSIYNTLESNLSRHESLRQGRQFAVDIGTITLLSADLGPSPISTAATFATFEQLPDLVASRPPLDADLYRSLEAALQRVTTIRPAKRRVDVKSDTSRGATMKVIERGIANLDFWQKKAAIETPDGPQRIRGLAGSGKTIVLALKAALLHAQNESWNIVVTFSSRALYQQFEDLVKRFSFAHMDDLPDPERLSIMHAWGSRGRDGVYTRLADALGVQPHNFRSAEQKFGREDAFEGACQELLEIARQREDIPPLFDAVLIDEAQDLPPAFFQLVHLFTKDPKRVVWAYDELQKLDETEMANVAELFGRTPTGEPVVNIQNRDDEPRRDIVLPVCYRNTPWALATAHAIGFGVYRSGGLVQHFDDPQLWEDIGYRLDAGALTLGSWVELERSADSSPKYFLERMDSADAVVLRGDFKDEQAQDEWVAEQIIRDVTDGELEHDDILVVLPSAYTSKRRYVRLARTFEEKGLPSHLVGVNNSTDEVFIRGSIAVAHIFRAKGNEAPMVYVVDSQYAGAPFSEVSRRNTIFTAITRSKGWVRVCGWGPAMAGIAGEVTQVQQADFKLRFTIPSAAELAEMRRVNADLQPDNAAARGLMTLEELAGALERNEITAEQLPPKLVRQLNQLSIPDDDL
ncbi:DEAD/DEAH box helicase [Microbacterium jejuense]|uniref:DEAD/DEAH box helicase n=1 Tax=Microbacterium jejuense TaxID=1263637 RepID=A0ABS7HKT1_9MICO|nr:ATP-binding domain-containing protein [Microbacterium jejuense]MBW9093040.1 DEAD/DEAH box helicase [Microbacterium jejuense]